jgi:arylsulfatase A-like enzyme
MISRNAIAANAKAGAAAGARIAALACAVDLVVFAATNASAGYDAAAVFAGLLAAAGAYGLIALELAAFLAIAAAYVGGSRDLGGAVRGRLDGARRYLSSREPQLCRDFTARFFGAALGLAAGIAVAVPLSQRAVADIRTPIFAAAVAVGCTIGALAFAAAAWPVWRRTGELVAALTPRGWRPAFQIASALALAVAVGTFAIAWTWRSFGFALSWRGPIFALTFAATATTALAGGLPRWAPSRVARRAALAAGALLPLAGIAFAALMPRSLVRVNELLDGATGPISVAHGMAERLLDFDRDGYLSVLGQGDCRPFDARVNPAAKDTPNDGIDQNCSGADSARKITVAPARQDYPATPKPRPMPVILITIDSVSGPDMDLYGAPRKTMPALTRWADSAMVFERAFAFGPATRLSLPSVVTGRYMSSQAQPKKPVPHGVWGKGNVTLADILSHKGYATIAVAPDSYFSKTLRWIYQGFKKVILDPAKGPDGLTAPLVTDAALAALRETGGADRVFLWVHYNDAHLAGKSYALPREIAPFPGGEPKDEHDTKMLYIDGQLDRLLRGVDEVFGQKPRIVVVSADHGESFDETHIAKAKARHAWDLSTSVTHIPLIIQSPYGKPGRTKRVASNVDIVPTILNGLGFKGRDLQGDSLVPTLLTGADHNRPIIQEMFYPEFLARGKPPLAKAAIRRGEYVLHRRGGGFFLFDFVRDPGENNDLAARMPALAEELAGSLEVMIGGDED